MRQATFYAGVQARNACMQLTLLYKHESLSLARRTAARAAPSAAHMGEHRLVQLCPQNVKVLHFWADITTHGKVLSKTLQRSDVLLSELTAGVEDAEAHIGKLSQSPGRWMKVFDTDFDAARLELDGPHGGALVHALHDVLGHALLRFVLVYQPKSSRDVCVSCLYSSVNSVHAVRACIPA